MSAPRLVPGRQQERTTQTPAPTLDGTACSRYKHLRDQGLAAAQEGRLADSQTLCSEAYGLAQGMADPAVEALALCNLASVEIELGNGAGYVTRLRNILVRNRDEESCRLAAYHLARFYELGKEIKKSLFYARIALERSNQLGQDDWLASSHNLAGNALLAEFQTEDARKHYEQALALTEPSLAHQRSVILDNLGYCLVLQGRSEEGIGLLHRALRLCRKAVPATEVLTRLDLCYTLIELDRLGHARRHGRIALQLAEVLGDVDGVKNALYLLGEVAHLSGDDAQAQTCFSRLQRQFFPDADYLSEFLMSIDVRNLINLHA